MVAQHKFTLRTQILVVVGSLVTCLAATLSSLRLRGLRAPGTMRASRLVSAQASFALRPDGKRIAMFPRASPGGLASAALGGPG